MFYRGKLPHLQRDFKRHFVTYCTFQRWALPEQTRSIVLRCCLHDNDTKHFLHAAVIMPNHVHLVFTPWSMRRRTRSILWRRSWEQSKEHQHSFINRELGRTGRVWQTESFDRVLRSSESLVAKIAYIVENPVKKGCRPLSRLFLDLGPARECNPSQSADTR